MNNTVNFNRAEVKKDNRKTLNILATIGTYLSYCLAYAYTSWGIVSTYADNPMYAAMLNRITAPLLGGLLPFALYFFVVRMIAKNLSRVPSLDVKRLTFILKPFIIAANIVCFFVSMTYFAFRPLFVWGNILFSFVITAGFLTAYLFYASKRIADKSKIAIFITRAGGAFLFAYLLISIVNLIAGLL